MYLISQLWWGCLPAWWATYVRENDEYRRDRIRVLGPQPRTQLQRNDERHGRRGRRPRCEEALAAEQALPGGKNLRGLPGGAARPGDRCRGDRHAGQHAF